MFVFEKMYKFTLWVHVLDVKRKQYTVAWTEPNRNNQKPISKIKTELNRKKSEPRVSPTKKMDNVPDINCNGSLLSNVSSVKLIRSFSQHVGNLC